MASRLLLVGGGGHAASVVEVIKQLPEWAIVGIVERPGMHCQRRKFVKIIGFDQDLPQLLRRVDAALITVGQVKTAAPRVRLYQRLKQLNACLATIIAPNASVVATAQLGEGTVVMQFALVNAFAQIGANCIINTCALVEHDAVVGAHTHIATGAIVNGGAQIGSRCLVGSGAVVLQGIRVCDDVVIGAGAVVIQDITQPGTYVGTPARRVA
jgi:sugar O-acyltransferase (sialic acid O-acetyltransferase NeuD family)